MKSELTIEQNINGQFERLIIVDVHYTKGYSTPNGDYFRPDDDISGVIDSIEMDGDDITDELLQMGFSEHDIIFRCQGCPRATMETDIDISELEMKQI